MENGKQLGPYRIVERLGAGGMGEVYRARDSRLEREVAIKILPAAVAHDPQRLARFHEEARLLASVNHANIAAIHELDRVDGVEFFAQELVPGVSLAKRLKSGPLELDDALSIARQIAVALEVAHDNGLIHRDLKPANVMITPELQVKVLDFGLAMPITRGDGDIENTATQEIPAFARDETPTLSVDSAPTVLSTGPRASGVEGTPPYMSPEQARGRLVDRRTDIWSFGCVLYEMLTGNKCFPGETPLDILAAVVRADPDWSALPAETPPAVRALLQRALRKDPHKRLQHIGDARVRLEEVAEGFLEEHLVVEGGERTLAIGASVGWAAALLLIGGFTGAILQGALVESGPVAIDEAVAAAITLPPGQVVITEPYASLAISPDGGVVAYAAGTGEGHQLYLRRFDEFEPVAIPATTGASSPFFSPDGAWLGYFSGDGKLMKLPVAGGPAQRICDVPVGNTGATWGTDGRIIFGTAFTGAGLMVVSADGGEPTPITRPDPDRNELEHLWPDLVDDSGILLFSARDGSNRFSVHAMSLFSRQRMPLLDGVSDVRAFRDGTVIYAQDGTLYAVSFDAATLSLRDGPARIIDGISGSVDGRHASFAVSAAGRLVFVPGAAAAREQRLVWVDRNGLAEPLPFEPGRFGHPQLSPDGQRLAVDSPADGTVRILDLVRGTDTRLPVPGFSAMPVWNPGGDRILMAATVDGPAALYTMRADGVGEPLELLRKSTALWPRSWGRTGIAYYELNPDAGSGRDIWLVGDDGREPHPVVATEHNERSPMLSPDGRWLAYVSNESTRDEVYVRALNDDRRFLVSVSGGREPVWSRDGTELFYRLGDTMMGVAVEPGDPPEFGVPAPLFQGRFASDRNAFNQYYDVGLDGRFLMVLDDETNAASRGHLDVILDIDPLLAPAASGDRPSPGRGPRQ